MDILIMQSVYTPLYDHILARPKTRTPDPGAINFQILVDGFMNIYAFSSSSITWRLRRKLSKNSFSQYGHIKSLVDGFFTYPSVILYCYFRQHRERMCKPF